MDRKTHVNMLAAMDAAAFPLHWSQEEAVADAKEDKEPDPKSSAWRDELKKVVREVVSEHLGADDDDDSGTKAPGRKAPATRQSKEDDAYEATRRAVERLNDEKELKKLRDEKAKAEAEAAKHGPKEPTRARTLTRFLFGGGDE